MMVIEQISISYKNNQSKYKKQYLNVDFIC